MIIKIAYSARNSARTSLFCSNSARYPKTLRPFEPKSYGGARNILLLNWQYHSLVETVTFHLLRSLTKKMEQPTNIANANLRDITLIARYYPFVLSSAFNFLSTVMHIITVSDFPSF